MNGFKNGKPISAARAVGSRYYGEDEALFSALPLADQAVVRSWLDNNLTDKVLSKTVTDKIQKDTAIKITNNQVKDVLLSLGFKVADSSKLNWQMEREPVEEPIMVGQVPEETEIATLFGSVEEDGEPKRRRRRR